MSRPLLGFHRVPGSIDGLDGLRAWAIWLVLCRHGVRTAPKLPELEIAGWSLWTPLENGWVGVDLFFLLSGFLIGGHLIRRQAAERTPTLKKYVGARLLRIVPTYYAVLLLTVLGAFPGYAVDPEGLGMRVAYHALFLQDYLPSNINVAFWSLGVEEKFYLLAPFLVALILRWRGPRRIFGWSLLLLAPSALRALTVAYGGPATDYESHFVRLRSPFHVTFDGLVLGVLLAQLHHEPVTRLWLAARTRVLWVVGLGIVGVHLLPFDLMANLTLYDMTLQPLVLSLGFGAILLAVALEDSKRGHLASFPLLVGARLSYALYLVHLPLIPLSAAVATQWGLTGWGWATAYGILYLATSTAVATAIHFGVEQPFLRLKSRL